MTSVGNTGYFPGREWTVGVPAANRGCEMSTKLHGAGFTLDDEGLAQLALFARRDDCLNAFVPSDIRQLVGELQRMRTALAPFAAQASVKGGTPGAEKIKALLSYMFEHSPPGDELDVIQEFATACLNARTALNAEAQP